jgi:hypothetical protein
MTDPHPVPTPARTPIRKAWTPPGLNRLDVRTDTAGGVNPSGESDSPSGDKSF